MSPEPDKVAVDVAGRTLVLTNLGKVLYPGTGTTKADVIAYYTAVAPVLLPHVRDRPMTLTRWPDGVAGPSFFAKNAPGHTPDWVRTVTLPAPGSTKDRDLIRYLLVDDLPTLVWTANLAGLELHVPQWRVAGGGAPRPPDLLVLDLDPGPPATVVDCCRLALRLRDRLAADGLDAAAKTSGSKGLQLYAPLAGVSDPAAPSGYARQLAEACARAQPERVVAVMAKAARPGRVLVDWSQNNPAKTTVAPYSLRARPQPTVSTPVDWAEVEACADHGDPAALVFRTEDVLARVARDGDRFLAGTRPGALPAGSPR